MSDLRIVDELEGDPPAHYEQRNVGDVWQSDAHVLIVLSGDGNGPEYEVAHPAGCDNDCVVAFQLSEGGYEQPPGYPQIPTDVGMYLIRAEFVKGGWMAGGYIIDHDCYLIFDTLAPIIHKQPTQNNTPKQKPNQQKLVRHPNNPPVNQHTNPAP